MFDLSKWHVKKLLFRGCLSLLGEPVKYGLEASATGRESVDKVLTRFPSLELSHCEDTYLGTLTVIDKN